MRKPSFFHPYPKYLQIMDILRNRVLSEMQHGDRIPCEADLCKEFGVSRETIRQAVEPLVHDGLVNRTRGRGSFVSKRKAYVAPRTKLTGFVDDYLRVPTFSVVEKEVVRGDEEACASLGLEPEALLMRILRVSILDGDPLAYHIAYLPAGIGLRILEEKLECSSIASLLADPCGFRMEEDHQTIEADTANVEIAKHLQVSIGFPLLVMRRIYISHGERPIAYFKTYYRSDRYMYTVKLRQLDGRSEVIQPSNKQVPKLPIRAKHGRSVSGIKRRQTIKTPRDRPRALN